jgi:hypothetical protein
MIPLLIIGAVVGAALFLPPPPDRTLKSCPLPQKQEPLPAQTPAPVAPVIDKNHKDYWKTGEMFLVVGASQSGKTYWVKQQIKPVDRLLSWDIEQQYEDRCRVVRDIPTLASLVKKNDRNLRISYQPARQDRQQEFLEFCLVAFAFCSAGLTHRNDDLTPVKTYIVVEELASVTSVAKAPTEWGDLVRMGLKRNMYLYTITQRPTEIDKTTVGNCSQVHCGRVSTFDDAKRMSKMLSLPVEWIFDLKGEYKQSVHKNMITGVVTWDGIKKPCH